MTYGVIIQNVKAPCQSLKHFSKAKQKLVSKWGIGKHNIMDLQSLKVNGDVNTTGNRRAPAEGKEANLCLNSESKCLLFASWGYSTKL